MEQFEEDNVFSKKDSRENLRKIYSHGFDCQWLCKWSFVESVVLITCNYKRIKIILKKIQISIKIPFLFDYLQLKCAFVN